MSDCDLDTKILPSYNAGLNGIYTIRETSINFAGFQGKERAHMDGGIRKGFIRHSIFIFEVGLEG